MSISGVGGGLDAASVMALRARILQQSDQLGAMARAAPSVAPAAPAGGPAVPFAGAMEDALRQVSAVQAEASAAADGWVRGETQDLAAVMLARQKASLAFEATLQVRNKLLGAYKDVMGMPL